MLLWLALLFDSTGGEAAPVTPATVVAGRRSLFSRRRRRR